MPGTPFPSIAALPWAAGLFDHGALCQSTVKDVARGVDVLFLMVGYPDDVRFVVVDAGALLALRPPTFPVDMTSSDPAVSVEIAQAAAARQVVAIDAPVAGSDVGARSASPTIMAGGTPRSVARASPCSSGWGPSRIWVSRDPDDPRTS